MTTTAKRKSPRKAAPRQAASKANGANGQVTNGYPAAAEQEAVPVEAAVTPPAEAEDATEARPPTEHVLAEAVEVVPKLVHPYGEGTPIFVFNPKDGAAPIIFPRITQARPTKHFFWKIRRKEPLFQAYDWMDLCEVPEAIQERVWLLDDEETGRFLAGWYAPIITPQGVEVRGVLMLARVVGDYWHALVRDVMEMGYRADDILTELTFAEIASIILGAGPTTSVRHFIDQGWSRTDHLLANLQESNAGIAKLQQPYERPGIDQRQSEYGEVTPPKAAIKANVMTWDEMDELENRRKKIAESGTHRTVRSHAWAAG